MNLNLFVHCNENPIMYSFSGNCAASPQFRGHVSVNDIYIQRIGPPPIFMQQNRQTDHGTYKSLPETWMWKLGLRPHNSFSGNIYFEFSILCLCSVVPGRTVDPPDWCWPPAAQSPHHPAAAGWRRSSTACGHAHPSPGPAAPWCSVTALY